MPTEKVYVGRPTTRDKVYHTDEDCDIAGETKEWDKDVAETWGLEECQVCSDAIPRKGGPGISHQLEKIGKENYPKKSEP